MAHRAGKGREVTETTLNRIVESPEWKLEPEQSIPQELLDTVQVSHIGPVWERNPNWDGVSRLGPNGQYILPEFSLGHQILAWVHENLLAPDSTEERPEPFMPTYEQYRFILWWYAVDERGRWLYRRGVLQRLKGW